MKYFNCLAVFAGFNFRLAVWWAPLVLGVLLAQADPAQVVYYPPSGETESPDYQVTVNGQKVYCYTSYACGNTTYLNGRAVTPLTFGSFDFQGTVTVTVTFGQSLRDAGINTSCVTVRPLASGIQPTVSNNSITFQLSQPGQFSIEPGGQTGRPLHLFANGLEVNPPNPNASNVKALSPGIHSVADVTLSGSQTVLYFLPGQHQVPSISPVNDETIYVAGGAVVELAPNAGVNQADYDFNFGGIWFADVSALITSYWVNNLTVKGRGILSTRVALANRQRTSCFYERGNNNLIIQGVIFREPGNWTVNLDQGSNITVDNVKIIGYFVNSDGVEVGGCTNVLVENSFCHNADDAFEVKAWVPMSDVLFRNCVSWSDVGTCFGLAWEENATVSNVQFENCTAIHNLAGSTAQPVVGICANGATVGGISDITFENIVIEDVASSIIAPIKVLNDWYVGSQGGGWQQTGVATLPGNPYVPSPMYPSNPPASPISNVIFSNVTVLKSANSDIAVCAANASAPIQNVSFHNVTINGTPVTSSYPHLYTNQWVSGLSFVQTEGIVPNGTYTIRDVRGYVVDDPNGGGVGTGIDQKSYSGLGQQQWVVTSVDVGIYKITSALNGLALSGPSTYSQLVLQSYTGADDQLWAFQVNGSYLNIINVGTGQAMDDWGGGYAGQAVGQWTANTSNQNWTLTPVATARPQNGSTYHLISQVSGKALDNGSSYALGEPLMQWTNYANNSAQEWKLVDVGGGYFNLVCQKSQMYLDNGNTDTDGLSVVQYSNQGNSNQRWKFEDVGGGYYHVICQRNGKGLNNAGSQTDGSSVTQSTNVNSPNLGWRLEFIR